MKSRGRMYSGKEVIKAGEMLLDPELVHRDPAALSAAMDVLSYWRFSHEKPLDTAFNLLQKIAHKRDKSTIFAKRLKRYASIVSKLRRFNNMKLKNVQDIGGCRAIVSNEKKLRQLVRELRKRVEFRNSSGKIRSKDYIQNPKPDGYRGYHLIGTFSDEYGVPKNIEIQIRTSLQHDWATALEIVDLFTGQALKSNQGHPIWESFFRSVSYQFSLMESLHLFGSSKKVEKYEAYRDKVLSNPKLVEACREAQRLSNRLGVIVKLQAFAHSLKIVGDRLSEVAVSGYALIEVNLKKKQVSFGLFSEDMTEEAEKMYTKAEKSAAATDYLVVALVSTTAVGGIKEAFPNYFADSRDFVQHLMFINAVKLPSASVAPLSRLAELFGVVFRGPK